MDYTWLRAIMSEFTEVKFEEPLEGKMDTSDAGLNEGTLNEPLQDTIKRDLVAVYNKFKYVIQPMKHVRIKGARRKTRVSAAPLLQDWDLWGPLRVC